MAADAAGNDISAARIPVTGFVAIAPHGTILPTSAEGKATETLTLDPAFRKLGLLADDGGPEWAREPDGDALEFWQDGYTIPTGKAKASLTVKAAETNSLVRELVSGTAPDANGMVVIDASGNSDRYSLLVEIVYKSGNIRRFKVPSVTVASVKEDQSARGEITGYEIEFTILYDSTIGGHYAEWA